MKTTEEVQLQNWREPFDQIAEQLKRAGKTSITSLSEGVVYLLKAGPYYKIGNSINFEQRLGQIKLQLPYAVEELH